MSLYNMFFGKNPNTEIILAIIRFKESDVQRYRDCGFSDDGIYIYTRTGGGNREDYPNDALVESPYYLYDEDEEDDCTYATYYFKIPDEIKEDVEKFKNLMEEGITGKFIQWVCKTIEREETEKDKWSRVWNEQNKLVNNSTKTFICESNGHTITPLDDRSLEVYLKLIESVNGEQLSYSVRPLKVNIAENVKRWNFSNSDEMCRVKIDFGSKWEVDNDLWEHWEMKYKDKYPKAIATIRDDIKK